MFETRISAGATEKFQDERNLAQKRLRGPTMWQDMPKNALRDIANWRTKKNRAIAQNVPTLCLDDQNIKKEELETVGDLSKVCSQIVSNIADIWHELVDLTFLGRWNRLVRSVTTWTRAGDKRLARSISYIITQTITDNFCHVSNTAQALFRDSDVSGYLEDSKSTSA